jgi:hypothetical protein
MKKSDRNGTTNRLQHEYPFSLIIAKNENDHRWKTWRNCLNGRPEWTRTIDLIRVKDAL